LCNFDEIVEDGAPTGSCDPEYARGFRYGQEYGIAIGIDAGMEAERLRIVKSLKSYFALSQEPDEDGEIEVNEEWDCGFRAAIAIITNEYNHPRQDRK
jgi:hypothetical protein